MATTSEDFEDKMCSSSSNAITKEDRYLVSAYVLSKNLGILFFSELGAGLACLNAQLL
jgi:hypothetical protein